MLGYRAHAWEVARRIVQMADAFTVLATLAGLY